MKKVGLLLLLLILLIFSFNVSAFEILINEEEEVLSSQIKLDEIAEIKAVDLSAGELEELKNLKLEKSPAPGYKKRLTRVLVDLSIQNLGFAKNSYQLKMPKTITVSRKSKVIPAAEIKTMAENYLRENLDFSDQSIVIESNRSLADLEIGAGDYELQVAEDQNLNLPATNLKLELLQEEKIVRRIYYPVTIKLELDVYTAARDLSPNSKLNKSDFKKEKRLISGNPENIIRDWGAEDLSNKNLSRKMQAGDILKYNNLDTPLAVSWGDKLRLTINQNNIRLSTFVLARGRGKVGDVIKVENMDSGYEFRAEIVSETEVKRLSE
ncbi:MAG: flagellar basal body P-ring formation chaperone FlgA [Halanaerobium sp.]